MNINEVARQWKNYSDSTEPKWDEYPSTQVTVGLMKQFRSEILNAQRVDRGNENGEGRTDG
jgi:hypothetical protein